MALVWDFARQLDPAATPGSTVSYFDEMCQSFYIDSGEIKTQIAPLYQGQWETLERESEIAISNTGYSVLDVEYNFNEKLFAMAQHNNNIVLMVYEYMNIEIEEEVLDPIVIKKINSYDLSIWDLNGNIKILQNPHQFRGQSFNPILKDNINGQKTLTFSLPLYILDNDNCSIIENPFSKDLYNEQSVRLVLNRRGPKEKVYDFVIKSYTESISDGLPTMDVECQDAAMCELNKIALTFNTDEKADIGMIFSELPPLNPGKYTIWIDWHKVFRIWIPIGNSGVWREYPKSIYNIGLLPSLYYGDQISLGKNHLLFINGDSSLWGAGYNNHGTIGAQPWLDWDSPNYIQQLNDTI